LGNEADGDGAVAAERGHRRIRVALRHDVTGAAFALATLRGDTELELDLVESHAGAGVASDLAVGNSAADTDDHG
jgi:hypothetical protein